MILYLPSLALADSILRALGRGIELRAGEITNHVRNDYGSVSYRNVLRYLSAMARRGDVVRGDGVYRRAA